MTGQVMQPKAGGTLLLMFPVALIIAIILTAWPFIIGMVGVSIAWKLWDTYQWQQCCEKVNPHFNQLLIDNRGCMTALDLALKSNLSSGAAQRFLQRRAEEFGGQRTEVEDKGAVYYFLTANSLGSIFDDSEPVAELEGEPVELRPSFGLMPESAFTQSPVSIVAQPDDGVIAPQDALIQVDLAKRLDVNASTIGRHKSEPDFAQWSQEKDPEDVAWQYQSETKLFVPLESSSAS